MSKRQSKESSYALDEYLQDINRYPLMHEEEEKRVAYAARAGDRGAYEKLVNSNLRFVVSVAKKYQNRGLPLTDLIAEGNIGLLTAANKFDPDKGVKFISYAVWWVRQAILKAVAEQTGPYRIPLNVHGEINRVGKTYNRYLSLTGDDQLAIEKTIDELDAAFVEAQTHGIKDNREKRKASLEARVASPTARLLALKDIHRNTPSLDTVFDPSDTSSGSLQDKVASYQHTEEQTYSNAMLEVIEESLTTLNAREAKVLRLYFGLEGGGQELTLEAIGSMLGVTRERVRQIKERALNKLRAGPMGKKLEDFLEQDPAA